MAEMSWVSDLARSIGGPRRSEPSCVPVQAARAASADASDDPRNRRTAPRQETDVAARLRLPTSEHDCTIVDLSTGGMNVAAHDAVVAVGQQVSVITQNFPKLAGIVRWTAAGMFGVQFSQPITEQLIEKMGQIRRRIRLPRSARLPTELPCVVFFDGHRFDVTVENIAVGGMKMTTSEALDIGKRRTIRRGQALMIQFPDLLPIGGHVRWTCGTQCGIMFSRLLPIPVAEEIRRLGNLSHAWLEDVRQTHFELGKH